MSLSDTVEAVAARTGWGTAPLWTVARRVDRTGFPDAELLSVYRDWGVVRKADRDDNFNVESDDLTSYKFVKRGDLVLNKMKTWQGSLGVSDFEGIVSPAYFTCELSPTVHPRFIHYLLRSDLYIAMYAAASKGIRPNQWDLPYEAFRSLKALLPPMEEQRRIADFLDDQVARIDAILGGYAKQVALLDEVQISAYRELTTGDLDLPTWKVSQAFGTGSGATPPTDASDYFDGGIPWVNSGDLNDGLITQSARSVSESAVRELAALRLHAAGSLLIAMYGATVGRTGLLEIDATVNQAVCVLTPRGPVNAAYAQYWFIARRAEILSLASGSGQPNISQDVVRSLRLQLGDLTWQKMKLGQLRQTERDMSLRRTHIQELISLTDEYKRSLIIAAVTGELDATTARRGYRHEHGA